MDNPKMIDEIVEVAFDVLNDWEIDFMKSIRCQGCGSGREQLTVKQQAVLDKIYQKGL